jgi:hypothetical protein
MRVVAAAMVFAAFVCSAGCRAQPPLDPRPCFAAPFLSKMKGVPSWSEAEKALGPVLLASQRSKDFRQNEFTCALEGRSDPLMLCVSTGDETVYVCSTTYLAGR